MEKVYSSINALLAYAHKNLNLSKKNFNYVRNSIFRLLKLNSYSGDEKDFVVSDETPEKLLDEFTKACIAKNLFRVDDAEYYRDGVMGEIMLLPDAVQSLFEEKYTKEGSATALDWFYDYSIKCNYVAKALLDLNPRFTSKGLIITINKAKPEFRDPKKALSGNAAKEGYPKCNICNENEGFSGRNKRTLRTIDIMLGGEQWFWQYSPYGYFYQHGIAVNYEHIPMHIDRSTFEKLLDFVDMFPTYFIGCNAPLERIGGSVLAHDHFQGGGEILPMHKAKAVYTMVNSKYPDTLVEIPDWKGTVIRIVSMVRRNVEEISENIRLKWLLYKNPAFGLIPYDEKGIYHAISPTVIKTKRGYEMNIILRSNLTSSEYPDGIFHAHPEYHMIKKESIGLIEAQGLFILPGRLEKQLGEIQTLIVQGEPLCATLQDFALVYNEVCERVGENRNIKKVHYAMKETLGSICNAILENTAVFKDKSTTVLFMNDLGFDVLL